MTKLVPLLLLTAGIAFTSCIDKAYDLSKIDTDDLTIGDADSEFRIPLATLKVDMAKMTQGAVGLEDIIAETKLWLPDPLPDGAEYVDIPRLGTDWDYLLKIIRLLFEQLPTDNEKLDLLAQLIWDNQNYRNYLLDLIHLENVSQEVFKDAFKKLIIAQNIQVMDTTAGLAVNFLTTKVTIDPVEFEVEGFELDQSVIDLLSKNLDKPDHSLHLYGSIKSLLPVSVVLREAQFKPTNIAFSEIVIEAETTGQIREAKVLRDDLQKITQGITINLPIELTKYYPGKEFDLNRKDQLSIELKLVKRGALSLNL